MKKLMILITLVIIAGGLKSQVLTPVKWSYAAKKTGPHTAVVFLKATMDNGWHIYSQNVEEGGPVKTNFSFASSGAYSLDGNTIEPKAITKYEKTFGMNVSYFEKEVVFQQKIKLKSGQALVKGSLTYMVCNDRQCLPPTDVVFSIPIK